MAKTLREYKKIYMEETKGKSAIFKINFITGALATTNNQRIRTWLKREQIRQRGIRFRK